MDNTTKTLNFDREIPFPVIAQLPEDQKTRLRSVAQMLKMPEYAWGTNSYFRHLIFEAEERLGSGGATVPGNGLASAIVRIGRKVLIDLDEFDLWVEGHRMSSEKRSKQQSTAHADGLSSDVPSMALGARYDSNQQAVVTENLVAHRVGRLKP